MACDIFPRNRRDKNAAALIKKSRSSPSKRAQQLNAGQQKKRKRATWIQWLNSQMKDSTGARAGAQANLSPWLHAPLQAHGFSAPTAAVEPKLHAKLGSQRLSRTSTTDPWHGRYATLGDTLLGAGPFAVWRGQATTKPCSAAWVTAMPVRTSFCASCSEVRCDLDGTWHSF